MAEGVSCKASHFNIGMCLCIYATYFVLFAKFFVDAYVLRSHKARDTNNNRLKKSQ